MENRLINSQYKKNNYKNMPEIIYKNYNSNCIIKNQQYKKLKNKIQLLKEFL